MNQPNDGLVPCIAGTCKDLILVLGSMEGHMQYSQCIRQYWITTLSFHNLDPLIDPSFLLNTNQGLLCSIYLGHGLHNQHLLELDMDILRPWCHHLILIKLVPTHLQPCICIHLSIPVSALECHLSITNMFTNHLHRYKQQPKPPIYDWSSHVQCFQKVYSFHVSCIMSCLRYVLY